MIFCPAVSKFMSAKNYTYIYSVAQGISWWDTKIVVFSDTQVPNLFEERRPKRQNLLETETHISLIIPFSCPALYHSSFRAIDARASCQITSNFLTSTMVIMVKTFIMVVKVVIVYRRTDLTFKLDFPGNLRCFHYEKVILSLCYINILFNLASYFPLQRPFISPL